MPSVAPSIFNDVLGPVMRGPSSSHTAASVRIGWLARGLMKEQFDKVVVDYDPNGSLATTAGPQGSNMGLAAGFLGLGCEHPDMMRAETLLREKGVEFTTVVTPVPEHTHPNTYRISLTSTTPSEAHWLLALSTGGGAIEVVSVDGVALGGKGDRHMLLVYASSSEAQEIEKKLSVAAAKYGWVQVRLLPGAVTPLHGSPTDTRIVAVDSCEALDTELVASLLASHPTADLRSLPCTMPVPRPPEIDLPFTTVERMQEYAEGKALTDLWELAISYECARGGLTREKVIELAGELVDIYSASLEQGLKGTEYHDRILGPQSREYQEKLRGGGLLELGVLNTVIANTSAFMEVKSSFGVIIAGPTAGSCGTVPGCLIGGGKAMGKTREDLTKALLSAGLVGVFIATLSTFAAEEGGCQAECGAAGAMAAAGLVTLQGGNARQCLAAASMTLQSVLGMVCDPVANRVEAPCLYRNVCAASMACSSANMALCNFTAVLPFDEVLAAHWEVAQALPRSLRCTGLGGLAAQPTARRLEAEMEATRLGKATGCSGCSCAGAAVSASTKW